MCQEHEKYFFCSPFERGFGKNMTKIVIFSSVASRRRLPKSIFFWSGISQVSDFARVVKRSQNQRWEISSAQRNHESLAKTSLSSPTQRRESRARNGWMRAWRKSYFFSYFGNWFSSDRQENFSTLNYIFRILFPSYIFFIINIIITLAHDEELTRSPCLMCADFWRSRKFEIPRQKGKRSAKNKTFPLSLFLPNENFCWFSSCVKCSSWIIILNRFLYATAQRITATTAASSIQVAKGIFTSLLNNK